MKKEYYLAHRDEILAKNKAYRELKKEELRIKAKIRHIENRERDLDRSKRHYEQNKAEYLERAKKQYLNDKEKHLENSRVWALNNPEKRKSSSRKYNKKYRATVKGHLSSTVSKRMNESLQKGMKAGRRWESLVGFNVDQLKSHIENLFKPEMTWENYGSYWHIDHIIPVSFFKFDTPDDIEFKLCWALENLQPLDARLNMSKGSKLDITIIVGKK